MFGLTFKFDELADKYGVIDRNYDISKYIHDKYIEEFTKRYNEIDKDTPIAFYGLGWEAEEIFQILSHLDKKNIVCLIDNNPYFKRYSNDYERFGVPIITPNEIGDYNISKIFTNNIKSEKTTLEYLYNNYPDIEVMSVYKNLMYEGYIIDFVFFSNKHNSTNYYLYFNEQMLKLEETELPDVKQPILKRLISMCLLFKDFVNAKLLIEKYIKSDFADKDCYLDFMNELFILLDAAKEKIANKKTKNMNLFIVDALSNKAATQIPAIQKLMDNGVHFKNSYSVSNSTGGSLMGMLSGKNFYKDGLYLYEPYCIYSNPFFNELRKDYIIKCDSSHINYFATKRKEGQQPSYLISLCMWNYLEDYIDEQTNSIHLIHSFPEIHPEFYHAKYNGKKLKCLYAVNYEIYYLLDKKQNRVQYFDTDDYNNQYADGLGYLNSQLEFYFDFLKNENDTHFIMGDHGLCLDDYHKTMFQEGLGNYYYNKEQFHPFLLMLNNNIKPQVVNENFSYSDFGKLLFNISKSNYNLSEYKRDCVCCLAVPVYNEDFVRYLKRAKLYDIIEGGLVLFTDTEKYIKFVSGREEYYLLPKEGKCDNLISDAKYANRLEFFRDLVKDINLQGAYENSKYSAFLRLDEL